MSDRKVALPDFASEAAEIRDELVSLRRAIHLEPEIGLDNPQTQAKILDALEGLPLEITLGRGLSSVTAVLRGGKPGPTVLLRETRMVSQCTSRPVCFCLYGGHHACVRT